MITVIQVILFHAVIDGIFIKIVDLAIDSNYTTFLAVAVVDFGLLAMHLPEIIDVDLGLRLRMIL